MAVFVRGAAVKRRLLVSIGRSATLVLAVCWIAACATGGPKKPPTGTPEPDRFLWVRIIVQPAPNILRGPIARIAARQHTGV